MSGEMTGDGASCGAGEHRALSEWGRVPTSRYTVLLTGSGSARRTGSGFDGGKRAAPRGCAASEINSASRAKSPKAHRTFGDLRLIEGQASRCAIRIDAAAKTIAA
jgi:hypothetical protein